MFKQSVKSFKFLRYQSGFSLLEVIVTISILTVAILGIGSLTAGLQKANKNSEKLSNAILLLQDRMESIRRLSYANISSLNGTENYGTISGYVNFKRITATTANSPDTNTTTITVSVFWDNDTKSKAISSIVAYQG